MSEQTKVDYIFGLGEMLCRIRKHNLQRNSILIMGYTHKHQCRSYVITQAIDNGWYSDEIKALLDHMASGRVVFYAKPHYTGACQETPREMTAETALDFQVRSGQCICEDQVRDLIKLVETAYIEYRHRFEEWMDNTKNIDCIRAGRFDIHKVDGPV